MLTVTKEITFDAAHRLMGHPGLCRSLHGHTYKVQITVASDGLNDGMVIDFAELKGEIANALSYWDHATILERCDPLAVILKSVKDIRLVILSNRPTAENMVEHIHILLSQIRPRILVQKIKLWETPTSFATKTWEV